MPVFARTKLPPRSAPVEWARCIEPVIRSCDVAIKVPPTLFVADAERAARFERDARTLAALNHPNIGGIYGHGPARRRDLAAGHARGLCGEPPNLPMIDVRNIAPFGSPRASR